MCKSSLITLAFSGCVGAFSASVSAAEIAGYLVDGSGNPVRSGTGSCIRTGSWSIEKPGIGCDAQPKQPTPDRIVLLPDADGKVGALIVRSRAGEATLNEAYAATDVGADGKLARRTENAASVQARYGATLGAQPPRPVSFTVNFAAGSSTELTPETKPVLDQIKAALAARPAPEIVVIGHTDRVGNAEANDKLSLRRADAVKNILLGVGIKAHHIEAAGRGEREPVVATADEVAEVRNRRVEVSIR